MSQYQSLDGEFNARLRQSSEVKSTIDYYLKNGETLMEYYDLLDSRVIPKTTPMLSLQQLIAKRNTTSNPELEPATKKIPQNNGQKRAELYENYLTDNDKNYIKPSIIKMFSNDTPLEEMCPQCGIPFEVFMTEAIARCPDCCTETCLVIDSEKPSYKDPPHESQNSEYQKSGYFNEYLSQMQAQETTNIPIEVYDAVLVEFHGERYTNLADLNETLVRKYLQKYTHLGFNKYYNNCHHIIFHLTGQAPLNINPIRLSQLKAMFTKIEPLCIELRPNGRKSAISYPCVLYKVFELLGMFEYLSYCNLLKDKKKLHSFDLIWEQICQRLGWPFHPFP
jgi:hypothetical protein